MMYSVYGITHSLNAIMFEGEWDAENVCASINRDHNAELSKVVELPVVPSDGAFNKHYLYCERPAYGFMLPERLFETPDDAGLYWSLTHPKRPTSEMPEIMRVWLFPETVKCGYERLSEVVSARCS